MKLLWQLLLALAAWPALAQPTPDRRLQRELDSIRVQDQYYRKLLAGLRHGKADSLAAALHLPPHQLAAYAHAQLQRVDSSNLHRVEELIWHGGYPGRSRVGSPTNEVAWQVLQHSAKIPQYLLWVQGAAEAGEIPYRLYAQMLDRKLMDDGQEQVYGTQVAGGAQVDYAGQRHSVEFVWPIKDPAHVDKRRRQAGFTTTLAESTAALGIRYQPISLEYALWLQQEAVPPPPAPAP